MFGRSACACAVAEASESPATAPSTTMFLFISPTSPWLRRQRSRTAAAEPDRRQADGGRRRRGDGRVALQAGRAGRRADGEAGRVVRAAAHLERPRRGGGGQDPLLDVT